MTLSSQALRSAGWATLAGYIQLIVSFFGNLVLARLLMPDDFGTFALATSFLAFLFILAGFGSQEAIIQCRDDSMVDLISTAFYMTLIISIGIGIVGTTMGLLLQSHFKPLVMQIFIAMSWLGALNNLTEVFGAILKRDLRYKPIATTTILVSIGSFIVGGVAAWFGAGAWALVVREMMLGIFRLPFFILASRYKPVLRFNLRSARWIWSFGWRIMVARITDIIFGRFDNFVVGISLGTVSLGYYALAYRLAFLGQQLAQGSVQSIVHSTFSIVQHSNSKLAFGFERLNYWLWRIVLLFGCGIVLTGENLVILLYGEKWLLAGKVFQTMFVFLTVLPLHENLRHFLIGAGHIDAVIRIRLIQLGVFVPGVVIAALIGNLFTVTWIVNLSMLLSWLLMLDFTRKIIGINYDYLFKSPLIAILISGGVCLTITNLIADSVTLAVLFVTQGLIITLGYVSVLFLIERRILVTEVTIIRSRFQP